MMFRKTKKILTIAITATMLVSAQFGAIGAFASPAKQPVKKVANLTATKQVVPQITKTNVTINGSENELDSITQGTATLVSAREFSIRFEAKLNFKSATKTLDVKYGDITLSVQNGNKYVKVNGVTKFMTYAPRVVQNKFFIEISQLTQYLGGQIIESNNGKEYTNFKLLEGVIDPQFLNDNAVLVTKETEEGFDHYVVSTDTRKYKKLNINVVTEIVVASPDGTKVAYTDDNSNVYYYNLAFDKEYKISEDISTKLELKWANDSSSLYYVDGEKQSSIGNIDLEGKITKYAADSIDYKSDLFILSNTTLLYTVTKTAKGSSTPSLTDGQEIPDFDVTIDPAGTEPTLYKVDLTSEVKTPVKITTTFENKTYSALLPNGNVVYLGTDLSDENAVPILKTIDNSLVTTNNLLFNVEPISFKVIGDKLISFGVFLDEDEQGETIIKQYIYELDPIKGKAKTITEVSEDISNVIIGNGSNQILGQDLDGKTYVLKKNGFFLLAN